MSNLITIVIVLAVAILLAVTNPTEEQHREAIHRGLAAHEGLLGAVGGIVTSRLPTYRSFVLGSYTELDGGVASIGLLRFVWVPGARRPGDSRG